MQLKKLTFWLSSTALLALAAMGFLLFIIWLAFNDVETAEAHRRQAIALDAQLQQETEQLTRLVRLYVVTGEPRYLMYYFEIIAIQKGEQALPPDFNPLVYWDQVIADAVEHKQYGAKPGTPFIDRMKLMNFSPLEFAAMEQVLAARDAMNELEQIAFAATQGLYDPLTDSYVSDGKPNQKYATDLVHGKEYNLRKVAQSEAMQALVNATNQRTQDERAHAANRLEQLILLSLSCMAGVILIVLASASIIRLQVLKPLQQLKNVADRLAAGEYVTRVEIVSPVHSAWHKNGQDRRNRRQFAVDEIAVLGATLNSMARAIDNDLRARTAVQQELENARQTAEAATRSKSQFLANMSHEIRTPMNAIIGMTYLALQTELSVRQQDYIGKAHAAARALLGIINSILDFSKIEAGKIRLENAAFRLEDVLGNAIILLRQAASEKDIELVLECADPQLLGSTTPLMGDALRLGEVLTNLLSNAVKFTDQGTVRLAVAVASREAGAVALHFTVEDSGIGITDEQMASLFDEFAQADASTTRRFGGTGLGLFISKKLVGLMDGRIWAERAPVLGSRFHFTARFALATETDESLQIDSAVLPQVKALRLLVVDDHADAADSLATLLRALGVGQVEVAHSASEALSLLHRQADYHYDLILVDWQMPDMDGATLLSELGHSTLNNRPQAVLLSGSDSNLLREHASQFDVKHFLTKPVLPGELRDLLNQILGAKQERRIAAPALDGNGRLRGMRVLLVEDNAINRQLAQELMAAWGVTCELAEHGKAGLATLAGAPPAYFHLVLTDLQMPVMDGYQMTSILRADPRYDLLPIVALTADVMQQERDRCTLLGMNGHLGKPLEPEQLFNMLAQFFQDRRRIRAAVDVHAIDGLDAADGLRRAGDSMEVYLKMLTMFGEEFSDAPARMEQLIGNADWNEAHRMMHTLKGLAGTIGAGRLAEHAARLEQACAASDGAAANALLAPLAASLLPLLAALPRGESGSPADAAAADAAMPEREVLLRLRYLLSQSNSGAILLWEQHQREFFPLLSKLTLHHISVALKNIDFELALSMLPADLPAPVMDMPQSAQI